MRALLADNGARAPQREARPLRPLQEHYSIRCVPQILGAFAETLENAAGVVVNEFNSVSDNPVFCPRQERAFHGGNFHGEPIAAAMDHLKASMAKCSMLFERQLNFLLNDELNKILPPFLNDGEPGVDFGMQGAQFTATSMTAHNQTLAFPMSVHSISCNKDNQDIVSMGADCALIAHDVVRNGAAVAAITAIACWRAVHILGLGGRVSTPSADFLQWLFSGNADGLQGGSPSSALIESTRDRLLAGDAGGA